MDPLTEKTASRSSFEYFTKNIFVRLMFIFVIGRMLASWLLPIFDPSEGRYSAMS